MFHQNINKAMELNILTSQKGTKVVTATNLHLALGLNNKHYSINVKKWLNDVYEFHDGIRKAIPLRDFAKRKTKDNTIISDYYFSLEFAKHITLKTNSKSKLKFALQLQALEDKSRNDHLITKEELSEAIDLASLLCSPVYQEICEKQHFKKYESRNSGSSANWWRHRTQVLGYSSESLKKKARFLGKKVEGQSQKQILSQIDKFEMIRTATIDLFMALDKTDQYARKMGDLTKAIAQKLNLKAPRNKKVTLEKPVPSTSILHQVLEFGYKSAEDAKLQRA